MKLPKPLSLHPLVQVVELPIGEPSIITLNFIAEVQKQSNWCWAAVATSVGLFYGTGAWTQCTVATAQVNSLQSPGGNYDCCVTPDSSTCNQYGYLDSALQYVNTFDKKTSGKAQADQIFTRLSEMQEVVCVRVAWFGGGAHFTTINGITDPSSGEDIYLTISDTIDGWGTTTILYSDFPNTYQSKGDWTHTYWTKNTQI
jgi:hypothetical protein